MKCNKGLLKTPLLMIIDKLLLFNNNSVLMSNKRVFNNPLFTKTLIEFI